MIDPDTGSEARPAVVDDTDADRVVVAEPAGTSISSLDLSRGAAVGEILDDEATELVDTAVDDMGSGDDGPATEDSVNT
ncbi:hypothetical protein [Rhodococcus sp. Q]|uniref:hypothetical protein n=1 Tax=Rhodococcus sp. Q TaxID=2502252 RepID=UPI0010F671D1|nr:hypothetical protein [Rhodococcus sp. Q]